MFIIFTCLFSLSIKPCGVDYQLKTHLAESLDEKPEKLWVWYIFKSKIKSKENENTFQVIMFHKIQFMQTWCHFRKTITPHPNPNFSFAHLNSISDQLLFVVCPVSSVSVNRHKTSLCKGTNEGPGPFLWWDTREIAKINWRLLYPQSQFDSNLGLSILG